jgi:DNA-binding transcriptional regulator YiaG
MKVFNTFKAKEYRADTKLGVGVGRNIRVQLLVPDVTKDNFNQDKHDHLIGSDEVTLIFKAAAEAFLKKNYLDILFGRRALAASELSGIREFLNLNATEFASILGVPKSTLSKLLKGDVRIKTPEASLAMERLSMELQASGYWRKILDEQTPPKKRRAS